MGDQKTAVLEYSENSVGWSDDLRTLHEDSIGNRHTIDIASRKDALGQVRQFLPSQRSVILEIGCSSGYFIRELVASFPEAVVMGADVVRQPLDRLAQEMPGIPLFRFDLLRCPLPRQSIDVIVMLNVLEHIDHDLGALQKVFDLLKPGGILVIEVPASPMLYGAYDIQLRHFRRYAAGEFFAKLKKAGFSIYRKSHLGFVLFPAFAIVKLWDKFFSSQQHKPVVSQQAGSTSHNPLVRWAFAFESTYLSGLSLPFGIRVLAVAGKQKQGAAA